jgi:hypothetical protein
MTKNGADAHVKRTELKISLGALVVSIIAIVVSQVRPLHEYFEKPELRLAVAPYIEVGTWQGHVEFRRYITLSNTGRKAWTALRTQMFVARLDGGGFAKVFPGATVSSQAPQFFANAGSISMPWHPVTIATDGDSTMYVTYTQPWSADEVSALTAVRNKVSAQLPSSLQTGGATTPTIDDPTFTELSRVVTANLSGFGVGRYGALTYFWDIDSSAPKIDKCDVIDVSDLNMQLFRDDLGRYRKGIGIVYPYNGPIPVFAVNTQDCDGHTSDDLKRSLSERKPS